MVGASLGIAGWMLTAACDGGAEEGGDDGSGASRVELTDEHNYSADVAITPPVLEAKAGSDIEICWDTIVNDIRCHAVDEPEETVQSIQLLVAKDQSKEEIQLLLANGQLGSSQLSTIASFVVEEGSTCASLSDMTVFGNPLDIASDFAENPDDTHIITFSAGTVAGQQTVTLAFVNPMESSSVESLSAPANDECGILDFSATLAPALEIASEGPWVFDWSSMEEDGQENEFPFGAVETLLLGFYEDMSPDDLEDSVLDLEQIATHMWEGSVSGTRINLSDVARRGDGDSFEGFDEYGDGTWIVGLVCTECSNPTPMLITVLDPT